MSKPNLTQKQKLLLRKLYLLSGDNLPVSFEEISKYSEQLYDDFYHEFNHEWWINKFYDDWITSNNPKDFLEFSGYPDFKITKVHQKFLDYIFEN